MEPLSEKRYLELHAPAGGDFLAARERLLAALPAGCTARRVEAARPQEVLQAVLEARGYASLCVVAYSGDTGFYSGACGLLPLLATRDFMITPQFLKLRYKIASERVEFPTVEERAQLSEPNAGLGGTQGALLARDSFEGFLAAVSGARAMRGAAIGSIAIAVMGGVMGLLVLTFLTFLGATLSASCWNLFLYTLLWLAPGILITSLSSRR